MPIHFNDMDIVSQAAGLESALIVPCQMCPAITVATRLNRPWIQFFKNGLKSVPFERYMDALQSDLDRKGIRTDVFWSPFPHQWFLCMWTAGQCRKLSVLAKDYEAVVVLGCESATQTVRSLIDPDSCRVIEGMAVTGIMNATLKFKFPFDVSFENCRIIPISRKDSRCRLQ